MTWIIEFSEKAQKEIKFLDRQVQIRIRDVVKEKLATDPNRFLIQLVGKFTGLFKFRVGDYRLICEKHDSKFIVIIIKVKHRREAYK